MWWAVQPNRCGCHLLLATLGKLSNFLSLVCHIFKMGIIISPPHRVTVRCKLQSQKAAEHSSVSGPAFGCQPVPYNQLNTGAHLPEQACPFPRGRALEGPSPADRSPASCPCTTLLGLGSQRLWVCLSGGIPEQNWEILNRGGTVLLALSSQST